jgi:hypothetical protein
MAISVAVSSLAAAITTTVATTVATAITTAVASAITTTVATSITTSITTTVAAATALATASTTFTGGMSGKCNDAGTVSGKIDAERHDCRNQRNRAAARDQVCQSPLVCFPKHVVLLLVDQVNTRRDPQAYKGNANGTPG